MHTTVVTELYDWRAQNLLLEFDQISKFVLANDTASLLLALISCYPERHDVYHELLFPQGNQISVRLVGTVLDECEVVSFLEASQRTLMLGEVLIGYVDREGDKRTVLNPLDKAAASLSCCVVDVLLTIAWGGGKQASEDWLGSQHGSQFNLAAQG